MPAQPMPEHPRLLFTPSSIAEMKDRVARYDWARERWNALKRRADDVLDDPIELPPRGGNWWHWYASPRNGAPLRTGEQIGPWRWEHVSPVDGEVFLGDPSEPSKDYDGVAISGVHSRYARIVLDLGIAHAMTGESGYADKARDVLLAYADKYLSYPLHTIRGEERIGGGRVGPQTLDEAVWLIPICQGADLIWDRLSERDRDEIGSKLLIPAARDVILPHDMGVHNIQCWKNSAVGLVGFLLGDDDLIREAIDNPTRGYRRQMEGGVLPDGVWWEGAWGYHFYTVSALWSLTEAARNCGIDLYGDAFRRMFEAPLNLVMPDGKLPAFNDSGTVDLRGSAPIYELSYARYGSERFADLLSASGATSDYALWFRLGDLPAATARTWTSENHTGSGYAVLARGEGADATWVCLKYGPHGGGHGHPDKLNLALYAHGELIGLDPGTARYGQPIQAGWYRTTFAHNTLTVDQTSQKPAEGRCLAFGSSDGVDFAVTQAGDIYDGVRFMRSVALVSAGLIVVHDRIDCDRDRTLDLAMHLEGSWEQVPAGEPWSVPEADGYRYLRDSTTRTSETTTLGLRVSDALRASVLLASGEPTEIITATGVGDHTEDRVPVVVFRRRGNRMSLAWCVALNGAPKSLKSEGTIVEAVDATGKRWRLDFGGDSVAVLDAP